MEKRFAENELSDHGLAGGNLFYEHVHPTFAGNYVLARESFGAVVSALEARLKGRPPGELPTAEQCARDIAYTRYDDVNVMAAMVRLTRTPPVLGQLEHFDRPNAREP